MPSVFDQPTSLPSVRAMCAIIREVVVLPLVPVTATTGIRGVIVRGPAPGLGGGDRGSAASLTAASMSALEQRVEDVADGAAHRLGPLAVAPREGDDELVRVAGGAHAHGEPRGAGLGRDRAHQPGHRARREPLPEAGLGRPGAGVAQPDPRWRSRCAVVVGRRRQPADVERQLDRRAREVEVGSLEDPELDEGATCVGGTAGG